MHSFIRMLSLSVIFTILLLTIGTQHAAAQQPTSPKTFPQIPERPPVSATPVQKDAGEQFQQVHAEWTIRWGEQSRAPRSVLGPPLAVGGGEPVQIARQFLSRNAALFGMPADLADLDTIRAETRRFSHVLFQQIYEDIPIEGSVYTVHMTKAGGVYYASGDYFDDVQVERTTPAISLAQAVGVATSDLGAGLELRDEPEGELVILPYGAEFRLAWKVIVPANMPSGRWIYYVSAIDGSILGGYNAARSATADGDVYYDHPENSSITTQTLTHLNGSGQYLDGSYVEVENEDGAEAYETDGSFSYSVLNTHFEEVMVYYHATEFQKYLGSGVGYLYLNYPSTLVKVQATVHYGTNHNNATATYPNTLEFGDGDGQTYNSFALEGNVIAHEYQHLVTMDITYDGLYSIDNTYDQEKAMGEAFSDYFGGSYVDSPEIGEYVWLNTGSLRDLENSHTVNEWDGLGGSDTWAADKYHEASQIFSGALWDLRQEFGESTANKLIFEGLDNLDQSSPDFEDGLDAIVAAAAALSLSTCTVKEIFADRKIGIPCRPEPPTSLDQVYNYGYNVKIGWTLSSSSGITEQRIYRLDNGTSWEYLATVSASATQYTDYEYYEADSPSWDDVYISYYVTAYRASTSQESVRSNVEDITADTYNKTAPALPEAFALHGNYPNPFEASTEIKFDLPKAVHVRLTVYDVMGREVARLVDETVPAGFQRVRWDTGGLPSGVYLYRIEAGDFTQTRHMTLVK